MTRNRFVKIISNNIEFHKNDPDNLLCTNSKDVEMRIQCSKCFIKKECNTKQMKIYFKKTNQRINEVILKEFYFHRSMEQW